MKKRINSSEIERAKRSNMFLFILTILMLFVVIGGLVFYVLYDKKLIKFDNFKNTTEEDIISKNETKFDVNIDNKEILRLYNIVKISNNSCIDYINLNNIKIDDLNEDCKFKLALNIYKENIVVENNRRYVSENDVSYAYESLFGENTYSTQETIPYIDNYKLMYFSPNYFIEGEVKESDSNMNTHEELLSVKKDNNYLYINSAVMYYESINKNICKDSGCNEIIETISEEPSSDYYSLYIKHNKNSLNNYKYKFRLDKNGFYKYIGFEKTNK